jgi:thiol:disulfide interchange protein DsbD
MAKLDSPCTSSTIKIALWSCIWFALTSGGGAINRALATTPAASPAPSPDANPTSAHREEAIPVIEDPLTIVSTKFVPAEAGPGATTELQLELSLAQHYHAYLDKFKIRIAHPETFKVDKPRLSPVIQFLDSISKKMKDGIEKTATLKATVEVPLDAATGETEIEFEVGYQACTSQHCLFPKTIPVKAKINVSSDAAVPALVRAAPPTGISEAKGFGSGSADKSPFEKALEKGVLSAFLFVFIGGLLTSLTPCVYPMIPITLAVIGARAKGQTRARSFSLSVSYVLGIATTYSALGVMAASTGAMFGSALSNVYIVTAIAMLFVAMGLSMYGLFEIQAPAFIRDKLGNAQTGTGFHGAYLSGLISGIVASPCIGPVLVTILAWIAQTGNRMLGFGLLFTFAMGMGILLIVLGTFSHLLNKVPKGGSWMEIVKFTFGTSMIAMALFYVAPLYPQWLFHGLLGAALILIASAYGAFEPNHALTGRGRIRKGAMIGTFVIGLAFALHAATDRAGMRFIASAGTGAATGGEGAQTTKLNWKPYSDELVAQAQTEQKPVLIDFFAEWCVACVELEKLTFPDPRIRDLADRFTLLKIDATEDSAELQRLKKKYGVIGLPTLIFIDTSGGVRNDLTVTGFEDAEKFSLRMKNVLELPTARND